MLLNYLQMGKRQEAKAVIAALDREIARVKVKIAEVRDMREELQNEDRSTELAGLRKRLVEELDADKAQ